MGVISFVNNQLMTVFYFHLIRLEADCAEMAHAVRGFDIMWRNLPSSDLLYIDLGKGEGSIKDKTSLSNSGLCPCLFVNIGSAMTIVGVSFHCYTYYFSVAISTILVPMHV